MSEATTLPTEPQPLPKVPLFIYNLNANGQLKIFHPTFRHSGAPEAPVPALHRRRRASRPLGRQDAGTQPRPARRLDPQVPGHRLPPQGQGLRPGGHSVLPGLRRLPVVGQLEAGDARNVQVG